MGSIIPEWLIKKCRDGCAVYKAPDGTFVIYDRSRDLDPLYGIPSRKLANKITKAIRQSYWNGSCESRAWDE